jgi:hypothetical protein
MQITRRVTFPKEFLSQSLNTAKKHYSVKVFVQLTGCVFHQKLDLPHKFRVLVSTLRFSVFATSCCSIFAHHNTAFPQVSRIYLVDLHADLESVGLFLLRSQTVIIQEQVLKLIVLFLLQFVFI